MLVLVRHGRTADNAAGLLLGRADPPLDDMGQAQAVALARTLAGATRIVTSPLQRARETASAIGPGADVDDRWVELDYGDFDRHPFSDVPIDVWARWRADIDFTPPGGESLARLGRRVRLACDELAEEASGADVIVVSHVSPIKAAVAWALGVGDEVAWRLHLAPAAITRVAIRPTGPSLVSFNDVAHLVP